MSQLLGIYKNYIYKVDAEMGKIAKEEILEDVVVFYTVNILYGFL